VFHSQIERKTLGLPSVDAGHYTDRA
jgi:hypothetical protein